MSKFKECLEARIDAIDAINEFGCEDITSLLGYDTYYLLARAHERDDAEGQRIDRILKALAGPNGKTVCRILLLRKTK